MSKSHNEEEYQDKVADDQRINLAWGKNLHKARLKAKTPKGETVSFNWLSDVTTIHHVSIRRFEKGKSGMTVANLVRLKDALGCSWGDLLDGCVSEVVRERKPRGMASKMNR